MTEQEWIEREYAKRPPITTEMREQAIRQWTEYFSRPR